MLDAAIRMLEAMVAMENIDANSDGFLGLEEIFKEDKTENINEDKNSTNDIEEIFEDILVYN